ncbi:AraC family transcriptional regulator [Bordetella sp. LUAb4]|uniref:AraC family transcriptional regulator n=1 Tax=Bordetella sp. LUAb4 TaxID=2843195 RepID=UPI001E448FD9|nr:AraC family transcriptional regulator [Bordetella sp. LUAb4]
MTETGIPRVVMVQGKIPEHELAAAYEPMVNLILRGSKSMSVGDQTLHYSPTNYFVMSVDLPAIGTVWPAASGEPYLAVALMLRPALIAALLADLPAFAGPATTHSAAAGYTQAQEPEPEDAQTAFSVVAVTPPLMDAWVRMLGLMNHPADIPALAPVYEREILYRVLQGPHGAMLRAIARPDSAVARISLAIQWIRRDFAQPLRIEALANRAAMSESAFHRHFKAVTSLSPLQYQKRLRLLQARTLLVVGGRSVTSAALEVGYESSTQFSREYARAFGLPPARDSERLLAAYIPRPAL